MSQLLNFEMELCDSYDRLLDWIFDETVIYQENEEVIQLIVKIHDQLPINQ